MPKLWWARRSLRRRSPQLLLICLLACLAYGLKPIATPPLLPSRVASGAAAASPELTSLTAMLHKIVRRNRLANMERLNSLAIQIETVLAAAPCSGVSRRAGDASQVPLLDGTIPLPSIETLQALSAEQAAVINAARDFAWLNFEPRGGFWSAASRLLPRATHMPLSALSSLTLSLAIVGGEDAEAHAWLDELILCACWRVYDLRRAEIAQLRKATTLLRGSRWAERTHGLSRSFLSWLTALLHPPEVWWGDVGSGHEVHAAREVVDGPWALVEEETALTCSTLQRRVMDAMTALCMAWEAEVSFNGLNLDIVVVSPREEVLPIVIEVDGPQHFVAGDPSWPNGQTAARRRLIRALKHEFAGLVAITYADIDPGASIADVVRVVERRVAEEGLQLSLYRAGPLLEGDGGAWDVHVNLAAARDAQELLALLHTYRASGCFIDAGHWAATLHALARILPASADSGDHVEALQVEWREWVKQGGLQSGGVPFFTTAVLLKSLTRLGWGRGEAKLHLVLPQALDAAAATECVTPVSLTQYLEALHDIGCSISVGSSTANGVGTVLERVMDLVERTTTPTALCRLRAHDIAGLLCAVAAFLPQRCLADADAEDWRQAEVVVNRLVDALTRKCHLLGATELVEVVKACRRLGHDLDDDIVSAIMEAAGSSCAALNIDDLAHLTLREPGDVGDSEGSGGAIASQRDRRRAPQWLVVSEVRRRLRASSNGALLRLLRRYNKRDGALVQPPHAFRAMLTAELWRRQRELSEAHRALVVEVCTSEEVNRL